MFICHQYIFFEEVSVHIFCLFFSWLVFLLFSFNNSLCILDISLYQIVFCKYFLPVFDMSFYFINVLSFYYYYVFNF